MTQCGADAEILSIHGVKAEEVPVVECYRSKDGMQLVFRCPPSIRYGERL